MPLRMSDERPASAKRPFVRLRSSLPVFAKGLSASLVVDRIVCFRRLAWADGLIDGAGALALLYQLMCPLRCHDLGAARVVFAIAEPGATL